MCAADLGSNSYELITLVQGDITRLAVDALVNAANSSLLGGGGVDGAIHRAAGAELAEECRRLHGCKTGEAKITGGYRLPAKHVIHTVGSVWRGGQHDEETLLARCYRNCLLLAEANACRTVAFPAISTGRYAFPVGRAAEIGVGEVTRFLSAHLLPESVMFVCFNTNQFTVYQSLLSA